MGHTCQQHVKYFDSSRFRATTGPVVRIRTTYAYTMKYIAYFMVSTRKQGQSGLGL